MRPSNISGDNASDFDLFAHALEWFEEKEKCIPEYLLHLRPTTPLRDPKIMEEAVELFFKHNAEASSLRSGHIAPESPYKWFLKDSNNYFKGLMDDMTPEKVNLPRQSFPSVYVPDGYIDILKSLFLSKILFILFFYINIIIWNFKIIISWILFYQFTER